MRFLIVDDDELVARAVSRLVRAMGGEVVVASSCDGAISAIASGGRIDAILCDQHLGSGPSGMVLLERARSLVPHALRVLMSGASPRDAAPHLVDCFLAKPFSMSDLRAVDERLRHRPTQPERVQG